MSVSDSIVERFFRVLMEEIRMKRPDYLAGPFTVAEIYQDLVPYGSHRDRIGVEINGDYEDALLRLLAGEGGHLTLESEHALRELREELEALNPNTGVYREFAAVDVRIEVASAPATSPPAVELETGPVAVDNEVDNEVDAEPDLILDVGSLAETPTEAGTEMSGGACRWCRAPLPTRSSLNFCPFCGTDVRVIPCAECGEELDPEWRFCISCGAEASG